MGQNTQKPVRRWFQFSLRALLIVVGVVAGLAFGYAKLIEPYRLQREAMAAITTLGGSYKTEDATGWVRYMDKNAQDVVVVDLADCDKPDEYLPHRARLPNLRTLVVGGHAVGDAELRAVERLWNLAWIGLGLDEKVSDGAVDGLKEASSDLVVWKSERRAVAELEKLGVRISGRNYGPSALVASWLRVEVGDMYFIISPSVGVRFIPGYRLSTDVDLLWLSNLNTLSAIDLRRADVSGSRLLALPALSSVEQLFLDATTITDSDLAYIRRFPNLRWLELSETHVSDDGLAHVVALKDLEHLDVSNTRITDTGTVFIGKMPSLERLDMSHTLLTDSGLGHLQRSTTLRHLVIGGTKVTDKGIPSLEGCARLTVLDVSGTAISRSGVQRLKAALPNCAIRY